ncbi:carotenoid 9,10(9',10')-cleavage dioxygenase 1-like protein [Tanacetum coccineum]
MQDRQKLKNHPSITSLLENGTVLQYDARTLNEGGPNLKFAPVAGYYWFDGDSMIHGLHIKDGKATYLSGYVKTSRLEQEEYFGGPKLMKVLPNVFTEILYTGSPWVYLIHNRGIKHKVWLEKVSGGYHNDGTECNGYDLDRVGFRQRRFLLTVDNLEESLVTFNWQGWHVLVYVERIEVGSRLVFSNLINNSISMIPFADSGLGLRFEMVPRMPLNGLAPFVVSPIDNEFHNDEKDCFYSPMVAYVTDLSKS